MSKKFYAVNRETGERWKPYQNFGDGADGFLVMFDSGYLAAVYNYQDYETFVSPLDPKIWRKVMQGEVE